MRRTFGRQRPSARPARDDFGVRTTPLLGTKPWFGPKRFGWGWTPISAEGWIATLLLVPASVVLGRQRKWAARLLVIAYVAVVVLKGTAPGGARRRGELDSP